MKEPEFNTIYGLDSIEFRIKFFHSNEKECLKACVKEFSRLLKGFKTGSK